MPRTIITNGKIFTGHMFIDDGAVCIADGKIQGVFKSQEKFNVQPGDDMIDAKGMIIAPGFVDIHIHGAAGSDIIDGTYEAVDAVSKAIAAHGTTAFLPTTVTAPLGNILKAVHAVAEAMQRGTFGAQAVGVHLEGPFINSAYKGAQAEMFIETPSRQAYDAMVGDYGNIIKRITMAPEMEGALELAHYFESKGVLISVGHTDASYEQMVQAREMGFSHVTHLFNGMNSIHHRQPGAPGAALADDSWTVEIIADGIHIHPAVLKLIWMCKGAERCALITDAMEATLMGDGVYRLGGQKVTVKDGRACLDNGSLAGSTLTMDRAVKNMVEMVGIPLIDALKMASCTPARLIGIDASKGYIAAGYDADIVFLDANDLSVKNVMIGGRRFVL